MSLNSPFPTNGFDTPSLPSNPRSHAPQGPPSSQPPQPPQQQQQQQQNGLGRGSLGVQAAGGSGSSGTGTMNGASSGYTGAGSLGAAGGGAAANWAVGGAGLGGAVGGLGAPTNVGEQMDMNVLWELVTNLAEVHQGIRDQTQGVLQRVQMVQARQDSNGTTNGTESASQIQTSNATAAELTALRTQLRESQSQSQLLTARNHSAWQLLSEHENTLSTLLSKLRPFASSHVTALAAQKAHYLSLLDAERTANLELRLEIARLQEGLGRAMDAARAAMLENERGRRVWRRKIAELKAENRVLAGICGVKGIGESEGMESEGWDADSGDEDDEGIEEGMIENEVRLGGL